MFHRTVTFDGDSQAIAGMLWPIHICLIALLSWWIYKIYGRSPARPYYWYGLFAKILAGVGFGLLYKYHFQGGDTWSFFEGSKVLVERFFEDPKSYFLWLSGNSWPDHLVNEIGYQGAPRALLMIKILSVLTLITGGNYWLSSAYLSLFAFGGLWALVDRIARTYPGATKAAVGAFIFLPSALFWSSGISKETLFMGVFGYLTAWFWPYFMRQNERKYYYWWLAIPMILVLFQLKYYYMAVLLPVLITTVIHSRILQRNQRLLMVHGTWIMIFSILIFGASWLHPNLRLDYFTAMVKNNALEIISKTGSRALVVFIENPDPTFWMGINLPWAMVTGIIRPNLGDWGSFLQNLVILENLTITILIIGRIRSLHNADLLPPDWFPCLVYVLILAGLLTLSTPNFGTLVRYKVSFMPVFVFLILYKNTWWDKVTAKLP